MRRLLTGRISETTTLNGHVEYVVEATVETAEHQSESARFSARYSALRRLHDQMRMAQPTAAQKMAEFPSKSFLGSSSRTVSKRSIMLDQWLASIVADDFLSQCTVLVDFLSHVLFSQTSTSLRSDHLVAKTSHVLYETETICPLCAILDRRGFNSWVRGEIRSTDDHRAELSYACGTHGRRCVPYCSDAGRASVYFALCVQPILQSIIIRPAGVLERMLQLAPVASHPSLHSEGIQTPLVCHVSLFEFGKFISTSHLLDIISSARELWKQGSKSVLLRLSCGAAVDMERLHDLCRVAVDAADMILVLLDTTFERMSSIAVLPDSVLMRGNVVPCITVRVRSGSEHEDARDVSGAVSVLEQIEGVLPVVCVSMETVSHDLSRFYDLMIGCGKLAGLMVSCGLTPRHAVAACSSPDAVREGPDLVNAIDCLVVASRGELTRESFVPLSSVSAVLNPLFDALFGMTFNLDVSPLCCVGTVVLVPRSGSRIPLWNVLDLDAIVAASRSATQPFTLAGCAALLKRCIRPNTPASTLKLFKKLLKGDVKECHAVVLGVHWNVDISALDRARKHAACGVNIVRGREMVCSCSAGM